MMSLKLNLSPPRAERHDSDVLPPHRNRRADALAKS
jgi:hypothetical protein